MKNDAYLLDQNQTTKNKAISKSPMNVKNELSGRMNQDRKNNYNNKFQKQNVEYQLDDFLGKDNRNNRNQRQSIGI